jgi:hypothetical protein
VIVKRAAQAGLVLGLAGGLCACILPAKMRGMNNLPVDPNSPVAKDVIYASHHPGPYPKFTDIPSVPTDVRPAAEWRAAISDIKAEGRKLDAQVAALPPPLTDTEAFAAASQSMSAAQPSEVPPADAQQQTESEARTLRERATPPPPPK